MKFLILSACVCMAVAAPQRGGFFNSAAKATANAAVTAGAVAASPFVAAADATVRGANYAANYVAGQDATAAVLRSESDVRPDGYDWSYETANGIAAQASAALKRVGDLDVVAVQGSYKYTAPDGSPVVFQYVADENGYQPSSDLLPVPPPVPAAIARSLEYIAAHPPAKEY